VTTEVFALQSRDFSEMEAALSGWDHQYQQVGAGEFRGEMLVSQNDTLQISQNIWERCIHYRGAAPQGTVGLAVTMSCSGPGYWNGVAVSPDDIILQRAGVEADYISGSRWDSFVVAIPETELVRQIANFTQKDPEGVLKDLEIIHLAPQHAAEIRHYAMNYLRTLKSCLADPEPTKELSQMGELMVKMLAQVMASSLTQHEETCGLAKRQQLIRKVEEFDDEYRTTPLQIAPLHNLTGLCSRTLQRAFNDQTGMSPLHYLKCRRLNYVRRILSDSSPDSTLVKQVAYDFGFHHLGQFSRDYQRLFGELPSHTLSKV
jgi:AraC family ethanolamine operon transcriptional activator